MNVFVAIDKGWEDFEILGIFSTLEQAKKSCEKDYMLYDLHIGGDCWYVEEYIIDNSDTINFWRFFEVENKWKETERRF